MKTMTLKLQGGGGQGLAAPQPPRVRFLLYQPRSTTLCVESYCCVVVLGFQFSCSRAPELADLAPRRAGCAAIPNTFARGQPMPEDDPPPPPSQRCPFRCSSKNNTCAVTGQPTPFKTTKARGMYNICVDQKISCVFTTQPALFQGNNWAPS